MTALGAAQPGWASPARRARPERLRRAAQAAWRHRVLYLMAAPFALLTAVFGLWPIATSVLVAFQDSTTALGDQPEWAGLANFRAVLGDPAFMRSLWLTLAFTVLSVVLNVAAALGLALFLALRRLRYVLPIMVFALLLPVVTPDVATLVVWKWMLDQRFGAVAAVLASLGLPPFPGLTQPGTAFASLVLVELWHHVGLFTLVFLSNIRLLDPALDEAASIDGAGWAARFLHVRLPQLRPAILVNTVYAAIQFLKTFSVVVVVTKGGPNFATNFVSYYAYQRFAEGEYGEATAMATVLFLAALLVSLLLVRVGARGARA